MRLKQYLITLFLMFTFLQVTELKADSELQALDIVDWHVHVAGLGHGDSGNFINSQMRNNFRFGFFLRWMNVTEAELEQYGDQIVVERVNQRIEQSKYIDHAVIS